jgi:Cdc6-like AAA superfamily ATPase
LGEDSATPWRRLEVVDEAEVTPARRIAGRVEEQQHLSAAIESATDGEPCAVFVHGEAGAGNTHLVKTVCRQAVGDGYAEPRLDSEPRRQR